MGLLKVLGGRRSRLAAPISDVQQPASPPAPVQETPPPTAVAAPFLTSEQTLVAELFDREWYLKVNMDVAAAGVDAFTHFLQSGEREGRDPNPAFSLRFYRATYMQDRPLDESPTVHYVRGGRNRGFDPDPQNALAGQTYARAVASREQSFGLELAEMRRHASAMVRTPIFAILLDGGDEVAIGELRQNLQTQIYGRWTVHPARAELAAWAAGTTEDWFLVWLEREDLLHPGALYSYASILNAATDSDVVYADEDEVDEIGGHDHPFFKPDWSPDYLEAFDYIGSGCCMRGPACASSLAEANGPFDLLLRVTEKARRVEHVRQVLVHRRRGLDRTKRASSISRDAEALHRRLGRTGRSGTVTPLYPDRKCFAVTLAREAEPLVSVVIPTAGKIIDLDGRRIDLLSNCLDHLKGVTTYKNIEIIVIHNDDLGEERLSGLAARGVRLLTYRGDFNVARKLNLGAEAGRGEFLLLLNDDVEPVTPDWIERMLDHFDKPHVGVVGAKLLYPTSRIQHAGVVMINAKPGHVRSNYPGDDEGYFFSTCAVRNFSAVTGAVMMTPAALYRELGGFAEELPVNFNDVDYCLRVGRANLACVYTPQAELIHYESASRTREVKAFEVDCIERRWSAFTRDPFFNQLVLKTDEPDFQFVPSRSPVG